MRSRVVSPALALSLSLAACGQKAAPPAEREPAPSASAASAPAAGASASASAATASSSPAPEPREPPIVGEVRFEVEPYEPGDGAAGSVFVVEGAAVFTDGRRVGKLVVDPKGGPKSDRVEWLAGAKLRADRRHMQILGRYPDGLHLVHEEIQAYGEVVRSHPNPHPTFAHLWGKGIVRDFGADEFNATLYNVVWAGASPIALVWRQSTEAHSASGEPRSTIEMVGGPTFKPVFTKPDERVGCSQGARPLAVDPSGIGGTPGGTFVAVGERCEGGLAAELWEPGSATSRVVDLRQLATPSDRPVQVVRGAGEDLYIRFPPNGALLRLRNGVFTKLADPHERARAISVSTDGVLHAYDGFAFFRFDDPGWTKLGSLPFVRVVSFVVVGDRLVINERKEIWYDGEEAPGGKPWPGGVLRPRAAEVTADCPTPFVYLYEVPAQFPPAFDFPATRKALKQFAGAESLQLLEFQRQGRRLGVGAPTKEQALAVAEHMKKHVKESRSFVMCLDPAKAHEGPGKPRVIAIK